MNKKTLVILILSSVVILLPMVAGLILWNTLPEQLPIHWNSEWEVDGVASKAMVVFGLPLLLAVIHWFGAAVMIADPKRRNHSQKMLSFAVWLIPVLSVVLHAFTYATALEIETPIEVVLPALGGVLFIIVGNYLPKCKQNYTMGIKLPWTLSSEENWNRTHRLAGWVWVIGGIAVMIVGCFGLLWLTLPVILLMALVPMIYSYVLYRKGV